MNQTILSKMESENKLVYLTENFNINLLNVESHHLTDDFFGNDLFIFFYPLDK